MLAEYAATLFYALKLALWYRTLLLTRNNNNGNECVRVACVFVLDLTRNNSNECVRVPCSGVACCIGVLHACVCVHACIISVPPKN